MRIINSFRRRLIPFSVARSRHVLTVSEFSRDAILQCFPDTRVTVIPCTIPESWFVSNDFPEPRDNYLLMVTATPPHKNAARALSAYATYVKRAGADAVNLRVVGLALAGESFHSIVRDAGISEKVVFEPFVSNTALQQLYRRRSSGHGFHRSWKALAYQSLKPWHRERRSLPRAAVRYRKSAAMPLNISIL